MADGTKIEWTDATWNIITGCSVVSPGCTNCYAMRLAGTRLKHIPSRDGLTRETKAGPVWTGEVRFNREWLAQPLRWSRPRQIFVCAHGDLFAEGVEDEWLDAIFAVMALCPQHTFQVLTKRPERMRDYLTTCPTALRRRAWANASAPGSLPISQHAIDAWLRTDASIEHRALYNATLVQFPLPNVWLGTSVEDQKRADDRASPMVSLSSAGWMTWVSYEPALGAVDWTGWENLDWIVSGGESGIGSRPSHPDWHRATRDFCATNDIAYHFKQWGTWREPLAGEEYDTGKGRLASPPAFLVSQTGTVHCFEETAGPNPTVMLGVGKKRAGRLLDGVEHNGFPEVRP